MTSEKRKEILKDTGIYTISSYAAQAFDIVNGILVRRFLGPAQMGIWTFLQVVQNYAKHSSLGVTTATARDVPYFREKGDAAKVEEVKNLVFTFTMLTSALTAIVIVGFALLKRHDYSKDIFIGLLVVAALVCVQRLYNLHIVLLRAHKEFAFTGLLNIFSSAASILLTVALTWRFQLYGFYASLILNYIACIGIITYKTQHRFSLLFDWKRLVPLITLGGAVLAADLLRSVMVSIDRIVIAKYLGFEALGIYSVALMADNYLYSLPNMLGVIFFPHFQEAFARRDQAGDLSKYLHEPTLGLSYFFPVLIGFVWFGSDWLVPAFLPKYSAGIPALKILSVGSFYLAFTHSFTTFLITIRKHWLLIPIYGVAIAFGFGINFIFLKAGGGIEGVAIAEGLTQIFFFLVLSAVSFALIKGLRQAWGLYFRVTVISLYFISALFLIDYLFRAWAGGLLKCFSEILVFLGLMFPVLFQGERETHSLKAFSGVFDSLLRACFRKKEEGKSHG